MYPSSLDVLRTTHFRRVYGNCHSATDLLGPIRNQQVHGRSIEEFKDAGPSRGVRRSDPLSGHLGSGVVRGLFGRFQQVLRPGNHRTDHDHQRCAKPLWRNQSDLRIRNVYQSGKHLVGVNADVIKAVELITSCMQAR